MDLLPRSLLNSTHGLALPIDAGPLSSVYTSYRHSFGSQIFPVGYPTLAEGLEQGSSAQTLCQQKKGKQDVLASILVSLRVIKFSDAPTRLSIKPILFLSCNLKNLATMFRISGPNMLYFVSVSLLACI